MSLFAMEHIGILFAIWRYSPLTTMMCNGPSGTYSENHSRLDLCFSLSYVESNLVVPCLIATIMACDIEKREMAIHR
ncbi:hypothetical protein Hdeb2414_s0018g00535991 [Helianthus debilis subsp. tardiflorus]